MLSKTLLYGVFHFLIMICSAVPGPFPASVPQEPYATPTNWLLPHRVQVGHLVDASTENKAVGRQPVQIPVQFCPEFFGDDPKLCSNCGGDNKVKGVCNNLLVSGDQFGCPPGKPCRGYYCKCSDSGGPDNSPKVTMTTVIDGQTGTAIWEPMTLSNYKGLRASETITLSETATASGSSQVETVVAVVFAGGIAWYLAAQYGSASAVLALKPPPQRPEGSQEDDKNCQEDQSCNDCGGPTAIGTCGIGDQTGCPCEKQECPEDGPPQCSASDCAGNDNVLECLAGGKMKGCHCCPTVLPNCLNGNCDPNTNRQCQGTKYKDCSCAYVLPVSETLVNVPWPPASNLASLRAAALLSIKNIWGGSIKNKPKIKRPYPAHPSAFCVPGAAPQQARVPKSYCQCGPNYGTLYSIATAGSNPCPWGPTMPGIRVTFSTPPPPPSPTVRSSSIAQSPSPSPKPTSKPPYPPGNSHFTCGALFCLTPVAA